MTDQTIEQAPKQTAEQLKAIKLSYEIQESFIIDSVNFFADDNDIHSVIKSFQRLKFEWSNPDEPNSTDGKKTFLSDLHAIETLLCDIAESRAKCTQLICDSYEQALE